MAYEILWQAFVIRSQNLLVGLGALNLLDRLNNRMHLSALLSDGNTYDSMESLLHIQYGLACSEYVLGPRANERTTTCVVHSIAPLA